MKVSGSKTPMNSFWMILENFGKIDNFGPLIEQGGGGAKSYLLRIWGTNFFLEPVTFLQMEIFKKKFIVLSLDDKPRAKLRR